MATLEEILKKSANVMARTEGIQITGQNNRNVYEQKSEPEGINKELLANSKIPKSIIESFMENPIDTSVMDPRNETQINNAINNVINDFDSDEKEMPTQEELLNRRMQQLSEQSHKTQVRTQPLNEVVSAPVPAQIDYQYIEFIMKKVIDEKMSKKDEGLIFKTFTMKDGTKYEGYVKKIS